MSVVDLLEKGLNDNQVFKAVLTLLEPTGLDHRVQGLVFRVRLG